MKMSISGTDRLIQFQPPTAMVLGRSTPWIIGAVLLLVPVSVADECRMTTSTADIDVNAGDFRYYVVVDCGAAIFKPCSGPQFDLLGIWWVYEEANAVPGLQRNDETFSDTCNGQFPSDHILL